MALERPAYLAGVAEEIYSRYDGPGNGFPSKSFTHQLLDKASVVLPAGVRVVDYDYATRPSGGRFKELANEDDYWQLCVADSTGRWATYGQTTGLQASGTTRRKPPCTYTGTRSRNADFDPRVFSQALYARVTTENYIETHQNHPIRELDAETLAHLHVALAPGWRAPVYDQRDYTELQYCLYAPDGEWFHVHRDAVEAYGSTGECTLKSLTGSGE